MGSFDIINPLSTVLRSGVIKSQQHQEKNSRECPEMNPGLLSDKASMGPLCFADPPSLFIPVNVLSFLVIQLTSLDLALKSLWTIITENT